MVLEIPLVGEYLSKLGGNTLQVSVKYVGWPATPKALPDTVPVLGVAQSDTITILVE
jgi:hypothetical protein